MRERYREWGWGLCYGVEREREREINSRVKEGVWVRERVRYGDGDMGLGF